MQWVRTLRERAKFILLHARWTERGSRRINRTLDVSAVGRMCVNCVGDQAHHLLRRFEKRDILEPPLHFRPLMTRRRIRLGAILLKSLMQNAEEGDWRLTAAVRILREFLEEEEVALIRALHRVFQCLAHLVEHEDDAPVTAKMDQ